MRTVNRISEQVIADDNKMIGTRIREARRRKGITQKQLATAAHITQATLSDIESGVTKSVKAGTLLLIASAVGEDPRYLQTGRRAVKDQTETTLAEDRVRQLYAAMSHSNRETWLSIGEVIAGRDSKAGVRHTSPQRLGQLDKIVSSAEGRTLSEVILQLHTILNKHGPDALAGAVTHLESVIRSKETNPATDRAPKGTKA